MNLPIYETVFVPAQRKKPSKFKIAASMPLDGEYLAWDLGETLNKLHKAGYNIEKIMPINMDRSNGGVATSHLEGVLIIAKLQQPNNKPPTHAQQIEVTE